VLVQLIVLDVAGIRVGHVLGTTVTGTIAFPPARCVHANTNETLAAFILPAPSASCTTRQAR
jgi:hypothetical protein